MRTLIAGNDQYLNEKTQEAVLRNGFECRPSDIASLDEAADYAGRARRVLTVLMLPSNPQQGIALLREVRNTSEGMLLAVGPANDPRFILQVLRAGADEYLDEGELDTELEATLVRLKTKRQTRSKSGKVIGVLAPSGGSGASTLAANLAAALARKHERVALLDLCLSSGDQTLLFDLTPAHTLADVCQNAERMDQIMFEQSLVRHDCGVHLLPAPKKFADAQHVNAYGIRQALNLARATFPYTVIDIDRTYGPEQIPALVQADLVLLVLRLDMTSLRNTQRTLERLDQLGVTMERVRIVVNRHRQPRELPTGKAEQALGEKLSHFVPDDPATVNGAINKGVPVVLDRPRARVSKSLTEVAQQLVKWLGRHEPDGSVEATPQRTGWFAGASSAE